ncbi:MAG: autotransporter domain-containing protein [Roseicyclus sp.]|uniref:autotransporter outer membrane beta-barrel domain-containing protein n=1 Tax=Roseicyclus sp. TaxID=1914329 RepID=UPI003A835D36
MKNALGFGGASLLAAITVTLITSDADAEDFFVSGAATTTNGGATANGADSVTVTESGSITTNSNLGSGLLATASDGNTLTNNGTITTSGSVSVGLVANTGDRNTLINNGTVTTSGSQSYGLSLRGTGNTMINNGTVTTSGATAHGFFNVSGDATIINRGTVTTSGAGAHGFSVSGGSSTVINSGTVRTSGAESHGLLLQSTNNTITNSGTVTTTGRQSHAIRIVGAGNTFTNTGTLTASGVDSNGLFAFGDNSVLSNSGTIFSEADNSIQISGQNVTLNLLRGSTLYGDVFFRSAATSTLNFGNGLNATVRISGTVPGTITVANGSYVVEGSTIHVVDANSFAISDRLPLTVGGLALDTLAANVSVDPAQVARGNVTTDASWIDVFGEQREHDAEGSTLAYTTDSWGVMTGRSLDASSGLFVGVAISDLGSSQIFNTRTDSFLAGYYVGYALGGMDLDASLSFGIAQNSTSRRIANSTVVGGLETARGAYMSYFMMPSATLSRDWHLGTTDVETSLRVRYAALHDQGYSETGAAAAMTVDRRTSHLGEVRLQVDGALIDVETASGSFRTNLRLGADTQYIESDRISGSVVGQSISFSDNGDTTSIRGFAALDVVHTLGHGTHELRGGFEVGRAESGNADFSASLRWRVRF